MELALALSLFHGLATVDEGRNIAGELGRFPQEEMVSLYRGMAYEHLTWLEARRDLDADINPGIDRLVKEQKAVIHIYQTLACARTCYFHRIKRQELSELRGLIGEENYNHGRLPMPLPCMERP